jgi:DNA-binding IclR family transcriptional regulator
LQHSGLAIQNGAGGSYRPSLKLVQMASRVLESYDFRGAARMHVQALAREVGHAVFAGVMEGAEVFYVEHAEGDAELRVHRRIGDRRSVHTSSIGKAIVAFLPQPERAAVVRACRFERRTAHTIVDRADYLEQLEEVRRRGWALVRDEDSVGAASVSAPVFDHEGQVVGAIGISVPSVMLVDETLERAVRLLRKACAAASAELGYRGGEGATQAG